MQEYNTIVSNCFCKLNEENIDNIADFIVEYMKSHGFIVKCAFWEDLYLVYPEADNLPIRLWRKEG